MELNFVRACRRGDISTIERLLSESDLRELVDKRDTFWDECLATACEFGQMKVVHLILSKGCFNERYMEEDMDPYGSALQWASERGHLDIMQLMINRGAKDLDRSLWVACLQSQYNSILLLLQEGAVIDYTLVKYAMNNDFWFVEQEKIQLKLLGEGISRSQLTTIPTVNTLFAKLDQDNTIYKKEMFHVMPFRDLVFVCAQYICL